MSHRRARRSSVHSSRRLHLLALEARDVPAIAYTFTDDTLATYSGVTAGDTIQIGVTGGNVSVNGAIINGPGGVAASSILSLDLGGDGANDLIDLSGVLAADYSQLSTVIADGGAGANSLTLNDANQYVAFGSTDAGGAYNPNYSVFFSAIGTVTSGPGDDTFVLNDGVNVSGTLTAGTGTDTLDDSAYSTAVTINLTTNTATNVGGISGFENANGGSGDDSLIGNAGNNALTGGIGNDTLDARAGGADTLDAGAGNDLLRLDAGAAGSAVVTAGIDADTLSFAGTTTAVTIDLDGTAAQSVSGSYSLTFSSASEVEGFVGSSAADTITAAPLQGPARTIDGGTPSLPTLPGDTLNLNLLLTPAPDNGTLTVDGPGDGTYTADNYAPLTYTSIETFNANAPIPNVVINATATIRDFRVVRNGANLEVYNITSGIPGSPYFVATYASLQTLKINGRDAEANRLVVDYNGSGTPIPSPNANPIPANGLQFNGDGVITGSVAGTDRLDFSNGAFNNLATTFTGPAGGSVQPTDTAATALGTVTFNNTDSIDLSGGSFYPLSTSANTVSFTGYASFGSGTVDDFGTTTDGVSRLRPTAAVTFTATAFPNPSADFALDLSAAGNQTVQLGSTDTQFAPTRVLPTGDSTGDLFRVISTDFIRAATTAIRQTGSTFDLNGNSDTVAYFEGTGALALNSGATLTTGDVSNRTFSGVISGTGNLVKQGTGSWTLAGSVSNTYTGTTTVNTGSLLLQKTGGAIAVSGAALVIGDGVGGDNADIVQLIGAGNQIKSSTSINLFTTGQLDLNGFAQTIGATTLQTGATSAASIATGSGGTLTLNGNVDVIGAGAVGADVTGGGAAVLSGTRTFTVADGSAVSDLVIAVPVGGTGGLIKNGIGLLELSATGNGYIGASTLNAGTLRVSGSLTGTAGAISLNGAGSVLEGGPSGPRSIIGRGVIANANIVTVRTLQQLTNSATTAGITVNDGAGIFILNNTITNNRYGLDINGTSTTRVFAQGNDLRFNFGIAGSPGAGVRVQGGAYVDLGQVGGGFDYTGLNGGGIAQGSTGGNNFGTTAGDRYASSTGSALPTVSQAILNLKSGVPDNTAGPQGPPYDVYAQGNTFGVTVVGNDYTPLEQLIYHDADNAIRGFVNYVTPPNANPQLVLAPQLYDVSPTEPLAQRSMIRRIRLSFDNFVFVAAGTNGGLQLTRTASAADSAGQTGSSYLGPIPTSKVGIAFDVPTGQFRYDYGFTGANGVEVSGSLIDGRYKLGLDTAQIRAGNPTAGPTLNPVTPGPSTPTGTVNNYTFHRLFGDYDGTASNGQTTSADQTLFLTALNSKVGSAKYLAYFDSDNDGDVDAADQTQFQRRLNRYTVPLRVAGDL